MSMPLPISSENALQKRAETLLRTVMKNALVLRDDPDCYAARAEVMWAGSLSHNGLTGCGTDGGDWACHKMEHELSGLFDVAHGAGLAAVWGSWARYVYREDAARFARFAHKVMGVSGAGTHEEMAEFFIVLIDVLCGKQFLSIYCIACFYCC